MLSILIAYLIRTNGLSELFLVTNKTTLLLQSVIGYKSGLYVVNTVFSGVRYSINAQYGVKGILKSESAESTVKQLKKPNSYLFSSNIVRHFPVIQFSKSKK